MLFHIVSDATSPLGAQRCSWRRGCGAHAQSWLRGLRRPRGTWGQGPATVAVPGQCPAWKDAARSVSRPARGRSPPPGSPWVPRAGRAAATASTKAPAQPRPLRVSWTPFQLCPLPNRSKLEARSLACQGSRATRAWGVAGLGALPVQGPRAGVLEAQACWPRGPLSGSAKKDADATSRARASWGSRVNFASPPPACPGAASQLPCFPQAILYNETGTVVCLIKHVLFRTQMFDYYLFLSKAH